MAISLNFDKREKGILIKRLSVEDSFQNIPTTNPYEERRYRTGEASVVIYNTGKVVIQGSEPLDHIMTRLTELLVENLYGCDLDWVQDGRLTGTPDKEYVPAPNRNLSAQRGWR